MLDIRRLQELAVEIGAPLTDAHVQNSTFMHTYMHFLVICTYCAYLVNMH